MYVGDVAGTFGVFSNARASMPLFQQRLKQYVQNNQNKAHIYRVRINYRRISLRSCRLNTVNVTFG
jgi:hypothetical protein